MAKKMVLTYLHVLDPGDLPLILRFHIKHHWIGLRENLQETIDFPIKYGVFLKIFPSSNSMKTASVSPKKNIPVGYGAPDVRYSGNKYLGGFRICAALVFMGDAATTHCVVPQEP